MRNRIVGFVVLGIAALIGFIIFTFNRALTDIVNTACEHGPACPMWGTIRFQTNVGIGIMVLVALVALYMIFFAKEKIEQTVVKQEIKAKEVKKEHYEEVLNKLNDDERKILELVIDSKGTIFQSALVEQSGFTKVKVTRLLDTLEGRKLIERKRRGMTNVVILSK
jgi:short subunit fatty acids transporter